MSRYPLYAPDKKSKSGTPLFANQIIMPQKIQHIVHHMGDLQTQTGWVALDKECNYLLENLFMEAFKHAHNAFENENVYQHTSVERQHR